MFTSYTILVDNETLQEVGVLVIACGRSMAMNGHFCPCPVVCLEWLNNASEISLLSVLYLTTKRSFLSLPSCPPFPLCCVCSSLASEWLSLLCVCVFVCVWMGLPSVQIPQFGYLISSKYEWLEADCHTHTYQAQWGEHTSRNTRFPCWVWKLMRARRETGTIVITEGG